MAKNTGDTKFRTLNVEDEGYVDEPLGEESHGPSEAEVNSLLTQQKPADALRIVLANPPVASKNQTAKDKAAQLVMRVLLTFKTSDIDQVVNGMDRSQLDILMKFIYRGFEFPSEGSSAQLLTWHEKVFAAGGLGCIVRVLTDRKKV